ncbi:unnamed protein product [Calypogeia fissa]
MPTLFRQFQTGKDIDPKPPERPTTGVASRGNGSSKRKMGNNRTSQVRLEVRREFLRTTTKGTQDEVYANPESLPSLEVAYDTFLRTYPNFSETFEVDDLRDREFFHLEESQHVCMDYCGFGLFSYYQQITNKATASFGLAYVAANLPTHALYGAADEGTVEFYIRKRVMDYLNINDSEYTVVFTASRGTAFKLLAESYPFDMNPRFLSVYDFESEAVNLMAECAKRKGAKITSACFKWPSLRIGTSHLKKLLQGKKKKGESARGLFVFPVQSRMTGAKYSYQWMSEAQQNNWHVLLDASSLGPKDMDSLGLSLFRPDFIISSFFKVFGTDPTGFGCLFIKNTAVHSLQKSSRARAVGMVRIVSLSNFTPDGHELNESDDDSEVQLHKRSWGLERHNEHSLSSFSGPFFPGEEPEGKEKHTIKESSHRPWRSWNRKSKVARHNKKHSVRLGGSNGIVDAASGIGRGDQSQVEFVAQPTKSRHYSAYTAPEMQREQPNRDNETGHSWELNPHLYEKSEDEIEELEDDQVSEVVNSRWSTNSQWRSQGRATGIQQEYEPFEFQSLGGRGISPIAEVDVEDQEAEESSESEMYSKAIDHAYGSGGAQTVFLDGRGDGGADGIDDDAVDLDSNSVDDLGQFDAETVEEAGRSKRGSSAVEDSHHGSGSDLKDLGSEEVLESNLTARRHQDAVNNGSEVENFEDSSNFVLTDELGNDVLKGSEFSRSASELGSQISVKGRLHSFERSASFEKQTGKQLSDFQAMGVQGLVQKFQGLHSVNGMHKEFEGSAEAESDLVLDEGSGNEEELRGTVVQDDPGRGTFESLSHSPVAGGNVKEPVDNEASTRERDGDLREGNPSVLENKPGAVSESGSLVDECERSTNRNIQCMPARETTVHSLQHSSSVSGHEQKPYESGEEKFITILPSNTAKNWSKPDSEAVIEARASGSQEQSDKETSSGLESEQRELVPTKDDASSPETRSRTEHAREEGRLFKPSRVRPGEEKGGTDHAFFASANLDDGKDQGFKNGRSDLRSNRTLSRDVDFDDEMYPGRRRYSSEMFEPRTLATAIAEDTARYDVDDSDDESFFQSQEYRGSLNQSRYLVDDLQSASYSEDEEDDSEDEDEDIPEVELQEDHGEPMISCKALDFADSVGLTKLNYRSRFLINWLVNSLLRLRHPGTNQGNPLVRIYGPKVAYDRGAALSFNVLDWKGLLIQPALVQRLADRCNISLGVGRLCNIVDPEMSSDFLAEKERLLGVHEIDRYKADHSPNAGKDVGKPGVAGEPLTIPVVTAAMGFVTGFEDVYKLWSFLAKFLDADYVSEEVWRYHSLNRKSKVM